MTLNSSSLVGMKIPWTTGRGDKKYTDEYFASILATYDATTHLKRGTSTRGEFQDEITPRVRAISPPAPTPGSCSAKSIKFFLWKLLTSLQPS